MNIEFLISITEERLLSHLSVFFMKVVALVQANGVTRLPNGVMKPINGVP